MEESKILGNLSINFSSNILIENMNFIFSLNDDLIILELRSTNSRDLEYRKNIKDDNPPT